MNKKERRVGLVVALLYNLNPGERNVGVQAECV